MKGLIDKGEMDFAAAAVRYSDSPNALEGGDLGWRSLDEIPRAFADMLKGMSAGQVVGPIRGPSGFQLLKLVETRDASQAAAKTVTEYHARHILVRVTPVQDAAAAKAKIDTLRARIAGGADFVEVAKESSEDANSKADGGDLGWFEGDAFGPAFGKEVAGTQRRPGFPAFPHRGRLAHRAAHRRTPDRRHQCHPACPGARDHRPPQAGGGIQPLPAAKCAAKPTSTSATASKQRPPQRPSQHPPPAAAE